MFRHTNLMSLESDKAIFQPTAFQTPSGGWYPDISLALAEQTEPMEWDPATVLSLLSFGHLWRPHTTERN